jgi:hypothetical protein
MVARLPTEEARYGVSRALASGSDSTKCWDASIIFVIPRILRLHARRSACPWFADDLSMNVTESFNATNRVSREVS